ncbi:hypothetical protein C8R47DRAFT_634170 [Mycena vitilis]|nr:hypothetical protein C8R47DRAFT_634170 [Mycena vitilis]
MAVPDHPCYIGRLPAELLLIIVDFLCERSTTPSTGCEPEHTIPTPHLHCLSLVCRHLRRLCLARLFVRLKITHTTSLRLLTAKCAADAEFAGLIRRLDLAHVNSPEEREDTKNRLEALARRRDAVRVISEKVDSEKYRYGPDILPTLLPCLKSLEWLDLSAKQINEKLLAIFNSHPSLSTVAVCDLHLNALQALSSSTSLSLSKIRVHSTLSDPSLRLQSSAMRSLMNGSPRLAHLTLHGETNVKAGPGTLSLPGLESLDIRMYTRPTLPMSWLPAFVDRHAGLKVIKFCGNDGIWRRNPDIVFPSQFLDAVEREPPPREVDVVAFSISRPQAASSLDDWPVIHLELKGVDASALRIARLMAAQLSSLVIRMPGFVKKRLHIDDLVASLSLFPSLQRLDLHGLYHHLLFEGQTPRALSPSDSIKQTSKCNDVHYALQHITARVAQRARSLSLIYITNAGTEFLPGTTLSRPWSLQVAYRVQQTRELEFHEPLDFVAAERFRLKPSSFTVCPLIHHSSHVVT